MNNMTLHTNIYSSPVGRLGIVFDNETIIRIELNAAPASDAMTITENVIRLRNELDDYFAGRHPTFTLPDISIGTPFMQRVWRELTHIPYGETVSYADLAAKVGSPNGYRAVAQACKRNPYPIIIPCHRVVASHGGIGGYAGGISMKEMLLSHEKQTKR